MSLPPVGGPTFGVSGALGTSGAGGGGTSIVAPDAGGGKDFGQLVRDGLQSVSDMEHRADGLVEALASGQDVAIHEVMAATSKAALSIDLLVQVRNRALEAYREIMNLQV